MSEGEREGSIMAWAVYRLRDVIKIKHGFAFSSEFFSTDGPNVLLTPGNFREEGGFRWLGEKQKFYGGPVPEDYVLSPGQMLIVMTEQAPGLLGSTLFVPEGYSFLHNQRLGLVQIEEPGRVCVQYLHFVFASSRLRKAISAESSGTKVKHTSPDKILALDVDLPTLSEQRKIAEILRTWDEAIETLETLIDRVKRQHLALSHSLIFGCRRLLRFKKSDDFTAHHWFVLPKEWDCQPVGKLAIEVSERNGSREAFEVLSCSKYEGFVRSLEYFKKQVFSSDLTGYKKIWRGDFGFPSNHVEEGSIGLQDLVDVAVVSPIYTVFRFIPEKIAKAFAFSALKTSLYRHIFEVSTSASVDRRGSLRWKEFAKIPFPVPPRSEQEAISEVLAVHSRKLTALEEQRDMYVRQKRGLMQKLLTGEWRVRA